VNRGLHEGRMALTIVGDGIRTELHALAAAVGAQPGFQYRLALVEMRLFQIGDQRLVVPVTTIKTVEVERAVVRILRASVSEKDIAVEVPPPVEGRSKRRAIFSEEEFRSELLKLKDGTIKARAADRLLARLSSNLHVEWRSASASIRAAEPTGAGELSLAMLNKSGRFSAYLPWLHGQLTRAWNNEVAVGQAVETHRQFLSQIGLRPTASGEEFFADLTALDGREEEVVSGLENVVAAIARIAAEHEVTAVS
jgi:hypothetical protein